VNTCLGALVRANARWLSPRGRRSVRFPGLLWPIIRSLDKIDQSQSVRRSRCGCDPGCRTLAEGGPAGLSSSERRCAGRIRDTGRFGTRMRTAADAGRSPVTLSACGTSAFGHGIDESSMNARASRRAPQRLSRSSFRFRSTAGSNRANPVGRGGILTGRDSAPSEEARNGGLSIGRPPFN
jgi:hypothetical protein